MFKVPIAIALVLTTLLPTANAASPALQITQPQQVALATDNSVWVLTRDKVLHSTATAQLLNEYPLPAGDITITKLAIAADNSVWVLFNDSPTRVIHYSAAGKLLSSLKLEASISVSDFKVAADGSLWLSDNQNHRIRHYRADGTALNQFGSEGTAAGQLFAPNSLALAADGSIWVTDGQLNYRGGLPLAHRIQHFGADGKFISQFEALTNATSPTGGPKTITDIVAAKDGSIWLAVNDYYFQHHAADGKLLEKIKSTAMGSQSAIANTLAIASDNSLWTISDNRFLRHSKPDGSVILQLMSNPSSCGSPTAEYDDLQNLVYLWDVKVGKDYYHAVLKLNQDRYELTSASKDLVDCSSLAGLNILASYDETSGALKVPYISVNNKVYAVQLTTVGKYAFKVESIGAAAPGPIF